MPRRQFKMSKCVVKPACQPQHGGSEFMAISRIRLLRWRVLLTRIWSQAETFLYYVVMTLVVLYFVLQSPGMQNWLIGRVTGYFSKAWNTEVRIGHIDVQFFDQLLLENVLVRDQAGDTLMACDRLKAGLRRNIFSLWRNCLEFDELEIQRARFYIRQPEGAKHNNIQFILDYFTPSSPAPPSEPAPFLLAIRQLRLHDVVFSSDDRVRGERMDFRLRDAVVRLDAFDAQKGFFNIRTVNISGFHFGLGESPARPLPARAPTPAPRVPTAPPDTLRFFVGSFRLERGSFRLDQYDIPPDDMDDAIDYEHMSVGEISVHADSIFFDDQLRFEGILRKLSAHEKSGFELNSCTANRVVVNDTITALYGVRLVTPQSELGDTIALRYRTYRDYRRFTERVKFDIRLKEGSHVWVQDIARFSPDLPQNSIFKRNLQRTLDISGHITGPVDRLKGRNMTIRSGQDLFFKGMFEGDDLSKGEGALRMRFVFDPLRSNIGSLRQILPDFNPPEAFDRLGDVEFRGEYLILFGYDHVLIGELNSALGQARTSIKLDLAEGKTKARYSGYLNLSGFDIGTFSDNTDLGKTTLRVNLAENSRGLTLESIKAKVSGVIDSLDYRGYRYRDIRMNGEFNPRKFDGELTVEDPNADFRFKGYISFRDTLPYLRFSADVRRLNLGALYFTDRDLSLSARIRQVYLDANNWDDLIGNVNIQNIRIVENKTDIYLIDSVVAASTAGAGNRKRFTLRSDFFYGELDGYFHLTTLANNVERLLYRNYPEFARMLRLTAPDSSAILDEEFRFLISVNDERGILRLIAPQIRALTGAFAQGTVDAFNEKTELRIDIPRLSYGTTSFFNTAFFWQGIEKVGFYQAMLPEVDASGRHFAPLTLFGDIEQNKTDFTLRTEDKADTTRYYLRNVNINASLRALDSVWEIRFNPSQLTLFNFSWAMYEKNYIRFKPGYLATRDFELFSDNKRILVEGAEDGRGLNISLTNFDLSLLDPILNQSDMALEGHIYDLDLRIRDVFAGKGITLGVETDTVYVRSGKNLMRKHAYGRLGLTAEWENKEQPIAFKALLQEDLYEAPLLRIAGAYNPGADEAIHVEEETRIAPHTIIAKAQINDFPLHIMEVFVPDISLVAGEFKAEALLHGPISAPKLDGEILITKGQFQIDYLKALFHLRNQTIRITETRINADQARIFDATLRSAATVTGGLSHHYFTDWRVDCTLRTEGANFLALNTVKGDNELFYGQGVGRFTAQFAGPFEQLSIRIDAETGRDTRLYLPLGTGGEVRETNFIVFNKKSKQTESEIATPAKPSPGIELEMNLRATEDAEIQLIFDEQAGDIVKSRGEGTLSLIMGKDGEFKMFGQYRIKRGEYLFTLLNWVNKPFFVAEGSTIVWNGDPYRAQINIQATYEQNASIYNLLQNEIATLESAQPDLAKLAKTPTKVLVNMNLRGELLTPSISFNLEFPNLDAQVRSLSDNKMRQLRSDQNELTRQVFGLIVVGSFLPAGDNQILQSADYLASAFNTLTQVLSNQFSNYLTGLATEWFGGKVSSIDFDIAYNEYRNNLFVENPNYAQVGRELQVRLTSGFADDRVTVQVGSQFGLGAPGVATQDGFLGENVVVEIALTENREWRLKLYQRSEPDISFGQRRRFGGGLSFRKDYDSFGDMMLGLTDWFRSGNRQNVN